MTDTDVHPAKKRWDRFREAMFRMLRPGLAMPVVSAIAIWLVRDSCHCDDSYGINRLPTVAAVILLLFLLGSMALRAWNHAHDVRNTDFRRLPSLAAVVHAMIYVLLILWPLALIARANDEFLLQTFGGALALLSVIDQASIVGRWEGRGPATSTGISPP